MEINRLYPHWVRIVSLSYRLSHSGISYGKQIKAKFSEMQDRMQQQMDQQQQDTFHSNNKSAGKTPAGDYIDFEEVK